jgi:tetratricopeptide (TPR) repeat protein
MDSPEDSKAPLSGAEGRAARAESRPAHQSRAGSNQIDSKWFWGIAAATMAIVAFPLASHFFSGASAGAAEENLLQLSAQRYQAKQYRQAIDAARGYLQTNPGSSEAYNNIAVSFLELGEYDEAERNAKQALQLDPNNDLAKHNLSWVASERAKAGGGAMPLAELPPAPAVVWLNLSLQQYNDKKFSACTTSAKAAIKALPAFAEAYNNLAACEIELKDYDAAIAAAQEAVRIKPDFQVARNNLAWALKVRDGK